MKVARHRPMRIHDRSIMKVANRLPMHVHDVEGESADYYPCHKRTLLVAKRIHDAECSF